MLTIAGAAAKMAGWQVETAGNNGEVAGKQMEERLQVAVVAVPSSQSQSTPKGAVRSLAHAGKLQEWRRWLLLRRRMVKEGVSRRCRLGLEKRR